MKHVAMSHGNLLVRRLGEALKVAHAHTKNTALGVAESMKNSSTIKRYLTGQATLTAGELMVVNAKKEENRIRRIKTSGALSRDALLSKPTDVEE